MLTGGLRRPGNQNVGPSGLWHSVSARVLAAGKLGFGLARSTGCAECRDEFIEIYRWFTREP
jgi:hypothetical protein